MALWYSEISFVRDLTERHEKISFWVVLEDLKHQMNEMHGNT